MNPLRFLTTALVATVFITACSPQDTNNQTPQKAQDTRVQDNGFTAEFEQQYVNQCLKEQTSVNVDTKVYCLCMGSFVVRDNKAAEFMPLWEAHLAGNQSAEQQTRWDELATIAKKQRGCRIEKF